MINIGAISNPYPTLASEAQPAELNSVGRHGLDSNFLSSRPVPSIDETPAAQLNSNAPNGLEANLALGKEKQASSGADDSDQQQERRAEQQREASIEKQERAEIKELAARDREVRAHEQAHAAVGGQYAGAPQYEFQRGPDGVSYAVGGEVSIDVSKAATPEETIRKMQVVRRAALAPAEPSPQDRSVAAQAQATELEAKQDLAAENREQSRESSAEAARSENSNNAGSESSNGVGQGIASQGAAVINSSNDITASVINTFSPILPSSAIQNQLNDSIASTQLESRNGQLIDQRV
ncbi:putative metalloprotease CJM1_0395 family protein [Agaribacterium sp. ZY112]|uniref:putative metalloprotease CJM1_0395 family protein n=1 Tax=Agaribacterium sp. ZY112 TaxID=3233574 RepID=UPI00352346AF